MKISKIVFACITFSYINTEDISNSKLVYPIEKNKSDFVNSSFLSSNDLTNSQSKTDKQSTYKVSRDPFSLPINKNNISLISIIQDQNTEPGLDNKKMAILEYNDESSLVSVGEIVGLKWLVISISDKDIVLESLKTKKRKVVLLNYD